MRDLIHQKLVTDMTALTFTTGGALFGSVKRYFKDEIGGDDCLIETDGMDETIEGNSLDYRNYGFNIVYLNELESSVNAVDADKWISKFNNREDKILDYLQKEPSNLNSWGQSQSPIINVFKIRVQNAIEENVRTRKGYGKLKQIRFVVSVYITPQLL